MSLIRTPEERFTAIPDFPYQPQYFEHKGARVHYIDEGQGEPILCLHGEPSWSYLYRKFMPVLSPHYRLLAPDLIGFGKSDKYTKMEEYNYQMHLQTLEAFLEHTGISNITVVVQDWGGLLGLGLLGAHPDKFARVVIMNTALPIGNRPMPFPFKVWRAFAKYWPGLPVGFILKIGCAKLLSDEARKAYEAPFPDGRYKAGAKVFPLLVPSKPTDPGVAEMTRAREVLKQWNKPALVMFSDKDPIMRGADKWFRQNIPTANDEPFIVIKGASHFLQEDSGEEIAGHIKEFMERRPV